MSTLKYILLVLVLLAFGYSCEDGERDNFPKTSFIGYFNIRDPLFSGDTFTATRDIDGNRVGIAGIIVHRVSATQYVALERMCPYEKKHTCAVNYDPKNGTADCECCGSQFLITGGSGDIVEGPSQWPLKQYRTSVQGSMLVVSSP